jgi:hypothetical protein
MRFAAWPLSLAVLVPTCAASELLPKEVSQAIEESRVACKPDKIGLPRGFIEHRDVNGDGIAARTAGSDDKPDFHGLNPSMRPRGSY